MNYISLLFTVLLLAGCSDYTFEFDGKGEREGVTLSIPKELVNEYRGWKYDQNGPFSLLLSYPDMGVGSYSSDNWLSISVMFTRITDIERTLDSTYVRASCDQKTIIRKYSPNGEKSGFSEYIHNSPGSLSPYLIYQPIKKHKGLYCVTCIGGKTCTIHGVSTSGISFEATSPIQEFLENWKSIYERSNRVLLSFEG